MPEKINEKAVELLSSINEHLITLERMGYDVTAVSSAMENLAEEIRDEFHTDEPVVEERHDYLVEQPGHLNAIMRLITPEQADNLRAVFTNAVITRIE